MIPDRRLFLKLSAATVALLNIGPYLKDGDMIPDKTKERLAKALLELNEAAEIGLSAEEFERSKDYVTGVYQEVNEKLRPIILPEELDLPIHFSAKRRP